MNAWPPQASYPCGNYSDTSSLDPKKPEGLCGPAFTVHIHTDNQDQARFFISIPGEVPVLPELALAHLCDSLTSVPPKSNSPPATVPGAGRGPGSLPRRLTPEARARRGAPAPATLRCEGTIH